MMHRLHDHKAVLSVFLDTEVFDGIQFDFENPHLLQLTDLVRQGKARVLSTRITDREVQAHIAERATSIHDSLSELLRKHPILRQAKVRPLSLLRSLPAADKFNDAAQKAYIRFRKACKVNVLPIDEVKPDKIFAKYFDKKPPFGAGKKKHQFPDAFAAAALVRWCNQQDQHVYVVSGDQDWKDICQDNRHLIYKPHLSSLLALSPDQNLAGAIASAINARSKVIKERIEAKFTKLSFHLTDLDGDIDDVHVGTVVLGDIYVIEASGGTARADVEYSVDFTAYVTYKDGEESGDVDDSYSDLAEVQLFYEREKPDNASIKSIHLYGSDVDVSGWELEDD